jgi:diacylglycerol kinase (ATP)
MRACVYLKPGVTAAAADSFHVPGAELWIKQDPAQADAALVFGGDGTIHRHLCTIMDNKLPLLMVPVGSGNDFAHALGITSPLRALAAWRRYVEKQDNVRTIDLGVIRDAEGKEHIFCCVAGTGLDAVAARKAAGMPRWMRARGGYLVAAVRTLLTYRPEPITVTAERDELSAPAMFVAVANAPSYGDGMRIAPNAEMEDGQLDIIFVHRMGKLRLLRLIPTVFAGTHIREPEVVSLRTASLRLRTERPQDVYADGEYVAQTPVEIFVRARALNVIGPA